MVTGRDPLKCLKLNFLEKKDDETAQFLNLFLTNDTNCMYVQLSVSLEFTSRHACSLKTWIPRSISTMIIVLVCKKKFKIIIQKMTDHGCTKISSYSE